MGCHVHQARLTLLWGQLGGAATSQLPHAGRRHWGPLAQGGGVTWQLRWGGRVLRLSRQLSFQGEFPVREDLSDLTDEEAGPVQPPAPPKPPAPSFRLKDDADLFGLGLEEPGRKDSSEEGNCAGAPTPSCQAPADLTLALNTGLWSRGEGAAGRPPRGHKPCPQPCPLFSDHYQFPRHLTCGPIGSLCWRGQWAGVLPSLRQREGLVPGPAGDPQPLARQVPASS